MKTNKTFLINLTKEEAEALTCERLDGGNCDRFSPVCKGHFESKTTGRAKIFKELKKLRGIYEK